MKLRILLLSLIVSIGLNAFALDLSQMNIVFLGDSNTWIGGDDCSNPRGWNYWFTKLARPRSARSYARSGATWTCTDLTRINPSDYSEVLSDDNVILNQIVRLENAVQAGSQDSPDLILVMAGTNDAWFSYRRPGMLSLPVGGHKKIGGSQAKKMLPSQMTTLTGAVNAGVARLHKSFPKARILVLTPIPSVNISAKMLADVENAIKEGVSFHSPYAFVKSMGFGEYPMYPEHELSRPDYTVDGTHTSEHGADILSLLVFTSMRDMGIY